MGEAMAYDSLPFPDTVCPVPDVYIYYVPEMTNVWIRFLHLSTSHGHLWTKDWMIQTGPPLYQSYILDLGKSAGEFRVLQLVLLAAFGAIDDPLAAFMMVHSRVFGFKK